MDIRDLRYFQTIAKDIWRPPNKGKMKATALALAIFHPGLNVWGIVSVVVVGVGVPEDGGVQGTKLIRIKCMENVQTQAVSRVLTATGTRNEPKFVAEFDPAQNGAGEAPHKTDIEPSGPPESKKGGVD